MQKISRRKLATYCVKRILAGDAVADCVREIAAYLIATKRTREVDLVVRAIEEELEQHGTQILRVTTAHPLDDALRQAVVSLSTAPKKVLTEIVNPSVLGGIKIETPTEVYDATIHHKLLALRQAKL